MREFLPVVGARADDIPHEDVLDTWKVVQYFDNIARLEYRVL